MGRACQGEDGKIHKLVSLAQLWWSGGGEGGNVEHARVAGTKNRSMYRNAFASRFVVALNSKVNMRIGLLDISNLTNPVSSRRGVAVSNRILN